MEKNLTITNNESNAVQHPYDIFSHGSYITNCKRMYRFYYNDIASILEIDKIETDKIPDFIKKEFENLIQKETIHKEYNYEKKKMVIDEYHCFLENRVMFAICYDSIIILFANDSESFAHELFKKVMRFKVKPKSTSAISLIISNGDSLKTTELPIKKPQLDLKLHYNDEFQLVHKKTVSLLNEKEANGLFLFHGLPGTGKTTYIKYLIHCLKKKVIFLSPKMAGTLDHHSMTQLMIENKNAVLVIEDAEELITSRNNQQRNSNLSMILNLTDGLLGEGLNIQIIATFNTDLKNIDKALLRKGRLKIIYEFMTLSITKTNQLLQSLGHTEMCCSPMNVADIFHLEVDNNYTPTLRKAIGFGA